MLSCCSEGWSEAQAVPKWDGWGVYPVCFLKCVERLENVGVTSGAETGIGKRLKMVRLLGR